MNNYSETVSADHVSKSAFLITVLFYVVVGTILIVIGQENIVNLFPEGIMDFMDNLFQEVPQQEEVSQL